MISGQGFGSSVGSVRFGTTAATIVRWRNEEIIANVPGIAQGRHPITVRRAGSVAASNSFNFDVYQSRLVPVTFTVYNALPTVPGDEIYLTGNSVELGNWTATPQAAIGPMLTTADTYPNWWLTVGVPAGRSLEFKFIRIRADGSVSWENGSNHVVTTPASGVGNVNVNWQY